MTNFVFSRRAMQQAINRLAAVLEIEQLTDMVGRLNRPGDMRLPTMWEIVLLDAFAGVGTLRHEVELPSGRRPDIELAVAPSDGDALLIVGDIVSVSDTGLDEQNPVEMLSEEMFRLAAKHGLNPDHFGYDVRGDRVGPYGDGRIKLYLPPKSQLLALMKREVAPWIKSLKAAPQRPNRLEYDEQGVAFTLTYDPQQRYARGGHLSYNVAASRSKNPLFSALKRKASQLKQAPADTLRLIVACDGGCALLRQSAMGSSPGTFSAREVAQHFLRQNSSIDAVLLVMTKETWQVFGPKATRRMEYDLVFAPPRRQASPMTTEVLAALKDLIRAATGRMPTPMRSAYNALQRCREPGCWPDMIGGFKVSGDEVSLSSRALLRLLAGEITADEFISAHGWNEESNRENPFARMARLGSMVESVEVETAGDHDDDWLVIRFGPPDPAAAAFGIPPTPSSSPRKE